MSRATEIAVCCGTPLVFTFKFSGAEYYCLRCRRAFGMFDVHTVPKTSALDAERIRNEDEFERLAVDLVARGERRRDCDRCAFGEDHSRHCGDEARRRSDEAYRRLLP